MQSRQLSGPEVSHWTIRTDRYLFEQSLINLIVNAAEAAGRNGQVSVKAFQSGDQAVVQFHDSGPGISENERDKIFEPCYTDKKEGENAFFIRHPFG